MHVVKKHRLRQLHGPSMFAVKAKISGVLYNPPSSIDFNETSSYWSTPKSSKFLGFSLVTTWWDGFHWSAFRNYEGSTFTEKDRNKVNYQIGPNYRIGPGYAGRA